MKQKLSRSNQSEKLQISTPVPPNWPIRKTATEFGVSTQTVKNARKLKLESGLLAIPAKKQEEKVSEDIKTRVLSFFEDDEFSWICPGKKKKILYQCK